MDRSPVPRKPRANAPTAPKIPKLKPWKKVWCWFAGHRFEFITTRTYRWWHHGHSGGDRGVAIGRQGIRACMRCGTPKI